MTAQSKAVIKSYFETGDKPTQAQFINLIDSYADFGSVLTSLTGDVTITTPVSGSAIATISSAAVTGAKIANNTITTTNIFASAKSGTATVLATVSGSTTAGHAAVFDATGNIVDGGTGSSALVSLSTVTISSPAASVEFINGIGGLVFDSTYKYYIIGCTNLTSSSTSVNLTLQISSSSTYPTGAPYQYYYQNSNSGSASFSGGNSGSGDTYIDFGSSGAAVYNWNSILQIFGIGLSKSPNITHQSNANNGAIIYNKQGAGMLQTVITADRVKLQFTSGNIASGKVTLYGVL